MFALLLPFVGLLITKVVYKGLGRL
jgi:hypothetical protein